MFPQVVNALLTQMDKLKSSPNVIIMTTSNITAAIGKTDLYQLYILQFPSVQDAACYVGPFCQFFLFSTFISLIALF